jgi:hypothetical protein
MFDNEAFRHDLLRPSLIAINMYSENAEELLIATMAHESLGGTYLKQTKGPALGVFQMEPATYDDMWNHYIGNDVPLMKSILNACQYLQRPPAAHLTWNLRLATIMARVYYYRVRPPLPIKSDLDAIWLYYKNYWNTQVGSATKDAFVKNYYRFVGKKGEKLPAQVEAV